MAWTWGGPPGPGGRAPPSPRRLRADRNVKDERSNVIHEVKYKTIREEGKRRSLRPRAPIYRRASRDAPFP